MRQFLTKFRPTPTGPPTHLYPVDHYNTSYKWDNKTRTHTWRHCDQSDRLLTYFAYDQADSLGPKVSSLIPHTYLNTQPKLQNSPPYLEHRKAPKTPFRKQKSYIKNSFIKPRLIPTFG